MENIYFAFLLTTFAGLATVVGGFIAFAAKRTNTKFLAVSLGFSAGVMIYVSFVEILGKARISLAEEMGIVQASWVTAASFFGGIAVIAIIDRMLPSYENPHEMHRVEEISENKQEVEYKKLMNTGIFVAIAIGIHNFPEGLATFATALNDPKLGIAIAVAIAIHNIPEGIAVAIPIYYASGSKKKALWYTFLSGVAEPIGALLGCVFLCEYLDGYFYGIIFAAVAGIMVFISLDELLPAAQKYGEHHLSIYGLIAGMAVMALSLLLFM